MSAGNVFGAVERMARTGRLPVSVEAGGSADLAAVIARGARGIALAIVGAGLGLAAVLRR